MTFTKFTFCGIGERVQSVFGENEVTIRTHDSIRQKIGIMRCQDCLKLRHVFQQFNNRFCQFIVIKCVKLVNKHQRNICGGLIPIEESIQCACAAGSCFEKGQRYLCIEIQTLLTIGILSNNQIFFDARLMQKLFKFMQNSIIKDEIQIIRAVASVSDVSVLVKTAEP